MMSDLFLIRLENGNALILQAENEAEAIQVAGVTEEFFDASPGLPDRCRTAEGRAELVASGMGPQNFTIRKMSNLFLELHLEDGGDFTLGDMGEEFCDQLYAEYPVLDAAHKDKRWIKAIPEDDDSPIRRVLNAQVCAAVEAERARLLVK